MTTSREALAARQRELLLALVAGGEVPPGFDAERVRAQADALVAKRRSIVAALRPELALHVDFTEQFARYAAGTPKPASGSHGDAAAYADWVSSQRPRWRRSTRTITKP